MKNTLDYQEILHDLTEISKVGDNYDINNIDEVDQYYIEISDYVLSSVNHIYLASRENSAANDWECYVCKKKKKTIWANEG